MPRLEHNFDAPDRFVAGTVGEPGSRTFFLQARQANRLTTVACEKEQVMALAERLDAMLDEVAVRMGRTPEPADGPEDTGPLDQPIEEEFRAGTMTLAWEPDPERVVLEVFAVEATLSEITGTEETDSPATETESPAEPDTSDLELLTVRLTEAQARAFAKRAAAVVAAGRPSCPFCGQVIEASGHICPRANGYRRTG